MRTHWIVIAGFAAMMSTPGQAQTNRITEAAEAMGAAKLNTIQYAGSGKRVQTLGRPSSRASGGRASSSVSMASRSTIRRRA